MKDIINSQPPLTDADVAVLQEAQEVWPDGLRKDGNKSRDDGIERLSRLNALRTDIPDGYTYGSANIPWDYRITGYGRQLEHKCKTELTD